MLIVWYYMAVMVYFQLHLLALMNWFQSCVACNCLICPVLTWLTSTVTSMLHLEHFSLTRHTDTPAFLHIFSKNPQIRRINMFHADPEFFQKMSTFVATWNARSYYSTWENERIQFENVTKFDIQNERVNSRSSLPSTWSFLRLLLRKFSCRIPHTFKWT